MEIESAKVTPQKKVFFTANLNHLSIEFGAIGEWNWWFTQKQCHFCWMEKPIYMDGFEIWNGEFHHYSTWSSALDSGHIFRRWFISMLSLVVWNILICPYIGNRIIIPTDFHIFQRGRYATNQMRVIPLKPVSGQWISKDDDLQVVDIFFRLVAQPPTTALSAGPRPNPIVYH